MCGVISLGWNLNTGRGMADSRDDTHLKRCASALGIGEASVAAMTADQLGM